MVKARMGLNMSKYTLVYMPAHAKILQYVHMRCGQQTPFVDRKPMDFHSSTYFPNIFMFPKGPWVDIPRIQGTPGGKRQRSKSTMHCAGSEGRSQPGRHGRHGGATAG